MEILNRMDRSGHEQIIVWSDTSTGLKAIIAIHDTTLGPACGGLRILPYATECEAFDDALRLSEAMTYKSAAAGLSLGGGKAVIIADSHSQKTEALLRSFGRFVDTLGGRYVTATDVGSDSRDMECIRRETKHVVGLPVTAGGGGDTSIMTGFGLYTGMRACAKEVWGTASLQGRKVALQGFGKVAKHAAKHLLDEGAELVATDIYDGALAQARDLGIRVVEPDRIYEEDCDIFSPCALGSVLHPGTIPRLRCRIVAGAANNQLATSEDGWDLYRRGILYAPDFIVNAGGVINVSAEIGMRYNPELAREKTEGIFDTLLRVIQRSKEEEIPTFEAAINIAKERLAFVKSLTQTRRETATAGV